ncbi:MAG: hypothetical protein DPW18_07785 [Chloroflexi bacterium]|nr:hypothetical protein [Chloroflexota bacterium]MDL1942767.1 hypothetical protein [Chloroflexi bacterium CFX2]
MESKSFLRAFSLLLTIILVVFGMMTAAGQSPNSVPGMTVNLPPLASLDVPSQTADGFTVDIESYYADASRLVFKLLVTGGEEGFSLDGISLVTAENEFVNAGYGFFSPDGNPSVVLLEVLPAQLLEGDHFTGQLSFSVGSLSGGMPPAFFAFNLDIPVHPALILEPNETVSANGVDILLDRLVVTPAATQVYLCYVKPSEKDWTIGGGTTLRIGGRESGLGTYALLFDSDYGDLGKGAEPDWSPPIQKGRCVKIVFPLGTAEPGVLSLTIQNLEQSMPEVIPEEELAAARKKLLDQGIDMDWKVVDHGAGPVYRRLPPGMTEQKAFQRFIEALGYIHPGPWEFTLDIKP